MCLRIPSSAASDTKFHVNVNHCFLDAIFRGVVTGGVYRYKKINNSRTSAFVSSLLAVLLKCGTLTCFDFEIGMTS